MFCFKLCVDGLLEDWKVKKSKRWPTTQKLKKIWVSHLDCTAKLMLKGCFTTCNLCHTFVCCMSVCRFCQHYSINRARWNHETLQVCCWGQNESLKTGVVQQGSKVRGWEVGKRQLGPNWGWSYWMVLTRYPRFTNVGVWLTMHDYKVDAHSRVMGDTCKSLFSSANQVVR